MALLRKEIGNFQEKKELPLDARWAGPGGGPAFPFPSGPGFTAAVAEALAAGWDMVAACGSFVKRTLWPGFRQTRQPPGCLPASRPPIRLCAQAPPNSPPLFLLLRQKPGRLSVPISSEGTPSFLLAACTPLAAVSFLSAPWEADPCSPKES